MTMSDNTTQSPDEDPAPVELTEAQLKRRRGRNVAVGLALFAMVMVFYVIAVLKFNATGPVPRI